MTPWLFVAITAEAGVIVALWLRSRALAVERDAAEAKATKAAEIAAQDAINHLDEVRRANERQKGLEDELRKMERDLATCRDPAVVLGRLRGLLSGPGST